MTSFPKHEVVRFVADGGMPVIDIEGRRNGRGAYLCRSLECFDMAVRKKRLTYALGVSMTPEAYVILKEEYTKVISDAEVGE